MSQYMAEIQSVDIRAVLDEHAKFVSMAVREQSKLSTQLLKLECQNEKFNMEVENIKLQNQLNQVKSKYNTLSKIVEITQNQKKATEKEIVQLKNQVSSLSQQTNTKNLEIQRLYCQLRQSQKQLLQKIDATTAEYRKQQKVLQADHRQKQQNDAIKIAKLQKQIMGNETIINDLQKQVDRLKSKEINNGNKNKQLVDVINSICKIVGVASQDCMDGQEIVSRVGYRISWSLDQIDDIGRYLLSIEKCNTFKNVGIVERIQRVTQKLVKQVQTLERNRNQLETQINNVLETYIVGHERCYGFELLQTMNKKIKCMADEVEDLRIKAKQADKQKSQAMQKDKQMLNSQKESTQKKQININSKYASLIGQIDSMSNSIIQSCKSEEQKKSQQNLHNEVKNKIKSLVGQLKIKMEQNDYLATQIQQFKLDKKKLTVNKQYEAILIGSEMEKLQARLVKLVQAYCSPSEKWSMTYQDAFKYLQLRMQKLNIHNTLFQKRCLSEQFVINLSWIEQVILSYGAPSSKFITQFMKVSKNPIDFRQILSKKNTISICKSQKGALFGILIMEKVNKKKNEYIVAILSATKKIMYPKLNISTMTRVEVNQEGCLVVGRQSELSITKNLQIKMMSKQKGYFGLVNAKDVLNSGSASEITKINQMQVYEIIYI